MFDKVLNASLVRYWTKYETKPLLIFYIFETYFPEILNLVLKFWNSHIFLKHKIGRLTG